MNYNKAKFLHSVTKALESSIYYNREHIIILLTISIVVSCYVFSQYFGSRNKPKKSEQFPRSYIWDSNWLYRCLDPFFLILKAHEAALKGYRKVSNLNFKTYL